MASIGNYKGFSLMKENQDNNIQKNALNSANSLLNSKLFKFKKNTNPRRFGENLGANPFNNLINIESEQ